MLEIVAMIFVGKSFYQLAEKHNRNRWIYAILGVVSFYAGIFLGGIVIGLLYEYWLEKSIDDLNAIVLTLMALPIGALICWGLFKGLHSQWTKTAVQQNNGDVLDADMIDHNANQ
jgi:MFS family permease